MTDKQARYLTRLRDQSRLPERQWKALERWASVKLGGRQALIGVLKDDPEPNARRMLASIFQWHRSGGDATASYIVRVLLEADDTLDVQGLQLRLGEDLARTDNGVHAVISPPIATVKGADSGGT